jgi:hypothetical protein
MKRGLPIVVLLAACSRSPYEGFKLVGDDVHLRMHALGDGEHLPTDPDSVLFRFRVARNGEKPGSYLSVERWFLAKDLRSGAFAPMLARMREGDSLSLIAPAGAMPWSALNTDVGAIADTTHMRVEAGLLAIRTPRMIAEANERMRRMDPQGFEQRLIAAYRNEIGGEWTQWGSSAMYFRLRGTAIDTAAVRPGDRVTLEYTGRRLEDGRVFDDTERNGMPMQFRYGDPDQVVKGIEVAVGLLRAGQEGDFILPSDLAFGEKGVAGTLEPWTPVVYTVRLVSVVRSVAHRAPS